MNRAPCFLLPLFLSATLAAAPPATQPVTITVDKSRPLAISQLQLGVTHTQRSIDAGPPQSVPQARSLLSAVSAFHNQHIMGWGAGNPNPAPGVYDFRSLDARIKLIESLHGTPVLTLCAAPDWMKGGQPNQTDWSKIERAPLPQHYPDFANLAATIARRYPRVKHYQVWNEMKGFWDPATNNWHYQNYTRLYNLVYDALKAVSADIQVGGPYLVIEGTGSARGPWFTHAPITKRQQELLDYWLKHKRGADFLVIDRSIPDFHDQTPYTPQELMSLTPTFGQVVRQLRFKTDLPIWFAEYYGAKGNPDFTAAHYASIYHHIMLQGASAALLWSPIQSDVKHGLFTDTLQPLPHYNVFKAFHDHFPPGTLLYSTETSWPQVEAIASPIKIMLINKHHAPVDVDVPAHGTLKLGPYELRLLTRNPDGE